MADNPTPPQPELRIQPDDWPIALADTDGAQLVVAGPGAGKTEFLVRRATHLIDQLDVPGSALLTLTFSRRAAADLRGRVSAAVQSSTGGLNASTFHSFAFRFLELHGPSVLGWSEMPAILTGPEQVALVSELLAESPPAHWPSSFREPPRDPNSGFGGDRLHLAVAGAAHRCRGADVAGGRQRRLAGPSSLRPPVRRGTKTSRPYRLWNAAGDRSRAAGRRGCPGCVG